MQVIDFGRSFLTFTLGEDVNHARIQIESTYENVTTGERFLFGASCKAEDTYGTGNLFLEDNYDFSMIVSETDYCILRNSSSSHKNRYETGRIADRFVSMDQYLCPAKAPLLLGDNREIVEATLDNRPLVGITETLGRDGQVGAILTYPVKTMNVRKTEPWWQVDTGPVLVEAAGIAEGTIGSLLPAYIAYSHREHITNVIIQVATKLSDQSGASSVNHYSLQQTVRARSRIYAY